MISYVLAACLTLNVYLGQHRSLDTVSFHGHDAELFLSEVLKRSSNGLPYEIHPTDVIVQQLNDDDTYQATYWGPDLGLDHSACFTGLNTHLKGAGLDAIIRAIGVSA